MASAALAFFALAHGAGAAGLRCCRCGAIKARATVNKQENSDQLLDILLLYLSLSFLCIGGTIPLIPDMHRFFVEGRGLMTTTTELPATYRALAASVRQVPTSSTSPFRLPRRRHPQCLTLGGISFVPFVLMVITTWMFARLQANLARDRVARAGTGHGRADVCWLARVLLMRGFPSDWRARCSLASFIDAVCMLTKWHPLVDDCLLALAGVGSADARLWLPACSPRFIAALTRQPAQTLACKLCTYQRSAVSVIAVVSG